MDPTHGIPFFERFPEACAMVDKAGRVVRANPLAESLWGRLPDTGRPLAELVHPKDLVPLMAAIGAATPSNLRVRSLVGGDTRRWELVPTGAAEYFQSVAVV